MRRSRLDLMTLELLVGVDEHGGVGAASRAAGVAQPNASRALRQLERDLGIVLLERRATGSTLSANGTVVAHWARRVLADADQLLDVAEGLRSERSAQLTVGASITVAEHLMPRWLGGFRALHPDVQIQLQVHNSAQVFDLVVAQSCDVGFVESPTIPNTLRSTTVARDRLVVVVSPTHPWARRRRPLTVAQVAATPLILREPGSGTRTTLDLALAEYERAAPLLELGSAAAIRSSVLDGVGPAVMSTLAVADQLRTGELKIVEVDGWDLPRALRAVWRPQDAGDGPARDLIRMIRRQPGD
ncbi:LysR family transcriptional regulator [Gordonia sp. CPCC 206044]|uniref:LysR family transcriptional regulator n=1 Tax=Gordonia sp. CPCC 206044 TaxID=3140793 RepID=UPI003AF3DDAC